jgi:hypothetical protein
MDLTLKITLRSIMFAMAKYTSLLGWHINYRQKGFITLATNSFFHIEKINNILKLSWKVAAKNINHFVTSTLTLFEIS